MADPAYYKVLNENGSSCNDGRSVWPLPENGQPGAWLSVDPPLRPCKHGLHLCRREDLLYWLGPVIYRAEIHPESKRVDCDNKIVVSRARLVSRLTTWTERVARLLAADFAERALQRERAAGRKPDHRSWVAVEAARAFAEGRISEAARVAAEEAAREAARTLAEAAVWAAWAARAATERAAWAAAWAAAGAADAAWAAAGAAHAAMAAHTTAEQQWQMERLWWYLDGERVSHG